MFLNDDHTLCTFEQAKQLKELGVVQFARASFYEYPQGAHIPTMDKSADGGRVRLRHAAMYPSSPQGWDDYYAAFNTSELGEMLPVGMVSFKNREGKNKMAWACQYLDRKQYGTSEAQARAAMLIELINAEIMVVSVMRKLPHCAGESAAEFAAHPLPQVSAQREQYVNIANDLTEKEKAYLLTVDKTGLIEDFVNGDDAAVMRILERKGAVDKQGTRGHGHGIMYFPVEGVLRYIEAASGE